MRCLSGELRAGGELLEEHPMKSLLSKLETLADEAIGLLREERARRNAQPYLGARPDLFGPKGTETHWGAPVNPPSAMLDRTGCAPNHWPTFVGQSVIGAPKAE